MAFSKIIVNGTTNLDVTQTTATASDVLYGKTLVIADGTTATGTIQTVTAGTPTATKGSVSNHSISVTPSVTNTAGYISGGTKNGTAVTVSASELVSGSQTITDNGTVNVTNLASVTVDIDFVTYYTSTSAPTSSQGSDGDVWLVTA